MKVLIAVKTYPSLSSRYAELVCTAGFREDGSWIRIYPVPFRFLNENIQYKKWDWIDIDLERNPKDYRIESYKPVDIDRELKVIKHIGTGNNWEERRLIVLKNKPVTNLDSLIIKAKEEKISLAVLKPTKVEDFIWEKIEREWDQNKIKEIYSNLGMPSLFEEDEKDSSFNLVKKLPYKFSYIFSTEDGKVRKLMIEDWELGMLYWNCLKLCNNNEEEACKKVKEKYFDEFIHKDLYFFYRHYFKISSICT